MKLYDVYLSAQNGNSCITLMIYIFHELLDTIYIYDFKICYRKTNHLLKIFVYLRSRKTEKDSTMQGLNPVSLRMGGTQPFEPSLLLLRACTGNKLGLGAKNGYQTLIN